MHPAIEALVQERRAEIDELCRRHGVRRLEVFGSAGGLWFEPARSDIDFLVEFAEHEDGRYADAYFGLAESLERVFGDPVDLVVASAVTNPFFLEHIARTRTLVYAA
jgi:predicted nucleotidyltransferase